MTLQGFENVTTIRRGCGRVNAYIQEHSPTQLAYREGVDVEEWITEECLLDHGEGVVERSLEAGVLTQAILDGREIMIHDVDRIPWMYLSLLRDIFQVFILF